MSVNKLLLFWVCLLCSVLNICAQNTLPTSKKYGENIYVYQLHKADLDELYKKQQAISEKFLHTYVTCYPCDQEPPELPRGNYLLVQAVGAKLEYNSHTVDQLQYHWLTREKFCLHVSDYAGSPIPGIRLRLGKRLLKLDSLTSTYTTRRFRKPRTLEIENQGVWHYIRIEPHTSGTYKPYPLQRWRRGMKNLFRPSRARNRYTSFMVFNKPKYKPGETVRFKAFIASEQGHPANQTVGVRLIRRPHTDTLLTLLKPYRPGMYHYDFRLSDSLKLRLDQTYKVDLVSPDLRRTYASGYFSLEEYELKGTTLNVRSSETHHQQQNPPHIFLKVTDENNMAIADGKCTISVEAVPPYTFHDTTGFIPTLLWKHEVSMAQPGEKEIILPDSIFPAHVSFNYTVKCLYQSSDQEQHMKTLRLYYNGSSSMLRFSETSTGLLIEQFTQGAPDTTSALIIHHSETGDMLHQDSVNLPFILRLTPATAYYTIQTKQVQETYNPVKFTRPLLESDFRRSPDSLYVTVDNPCGYFFWYTIREGKSILAQGYRPDLDYREKIRCDKDYSLSIEYLIGGRIRTWSDELKVRENQINIQVNTPPVVYPGQKTRVELNLSDYKGKPVPHADITAYALTSKLSAASPSIPYWEKGQTKPLQMFYSGKTLREVRKMQSLMDWQRWKKEMGLDSVEYYRFLYPEPLYLSVEPSPDSLTQVAPYVTIAGELQPIYVIKIDNQPYYYYGTKHLPVYSFPISPGKHAIRLRTYDSEILIDSVYIRPGTKTILSADIGQAHPEAGIFIFKTSKENQGQLSISEQLLLNKYMLSVTRNFSYEELVRSTLLLEKPAYLQSGNLLYYLNPSRSFLHRRNYVASESVLTGPFPGLDTVTLYLGNRPINQFVPECGYNYTIRSGYLKLKQHSTLWPERALTPFTPQPDFKARGLRPADIEKIQENHLKEYLQNSHIYFTDFRTTIKPEVFTSTYRLQLKVGKQADSLSPYLLLFFSPDKTLREIYSGNTREFPQLKAGELQLVMLFPDDSYYQCPLRLKPNGTNYLSIDSICRTKGDDYSRWINHFLASHVLYQRDTSHRQNTAENRFLSTRSGSSLPKEFTNHISGKVCNAFNGAPMPGVSVSIKGTQWGTSTDINGNFNMWAPATGTICFAFIGCKTQELSLGEGSRYYIFLEDDNTVLEEVVVTGYVEERKRFMAASTQITSSSRKSRHTESINIRSSEKQEYPPLVILNGLPYAGSIESIDEQLITSCKRISPPRSTELYGRAGQHGVMIITTANPDGQEQPGHSLRHHFRDDAFWQPALQTNEEGKASFEVTYPDDITNWQAHFIAIADRKKSGYTYASIKSFKALTARLLLPSFAIRGDRFQAIGRMNNYQDDTITVRQTVIVQGDSLKKTVVFSASHVDSIPVCVQAEDSLKMAFSLEKTDGFFDGEERTIPVYRAGCAEHQGIFEILSKDSLYTYHLNPRGEKITVHAETTANEIFLREIEKINIYPYLCNEQMASKLKALIAKKKIYRLLNRPFQEDKKIEKLISRLTQNQNSRGLWGWWNKQSTVTWISGHIVEALLAAGTEGYEVSFNKQLAIECLLSDLETTYAVREHGSFSKGNWLNMLMTLKMLGATIDYPHYVQEADRIESQSLYEMLLTLKMKQLAGMPVNKAEIMTHAHSTLMGNLYWEIQNPKDKPLPFIPASNIVQNTLLAYEILRSSDSECPELEKIRNYFFEIRRHGYWQNTYEASRIIETVFPDLVSPEAPYTAVKLKLNDELINDFPFTGEYAANTPIRINKTGTWPVFFTAWQTSWNPEPAAVNKGFEVETFFCQNKDTVIDLRKGETAKLSTRITATSDAEYVMIEIPIPAGCSYGSKSNNYGYTTVHQEYHKEKVVIFLSHLSRGTHQFTVELIPRFSGKYHLNPARAELMYFPTFYGREQIKATGIR